jgi:hypothetical protein
MKVSHLVVIPDRFELPLLEDIDEAIAAIAKRQKADDKLSLQRLESCRLYIEMRTKGCNLSQLEVASIFSKGRAAALLRKIITNSYRTEIHFLPGDGKAGESSAIASHSVALFRYAFSMPTTILNLAQYSSPSTWRSAVESLKPVHAILPMFPERPVRMATLKGDFLSDLISRYIGMYVRLGSRDFTEDTIEQYATELEG